MKRKQQEEEYQARMARAVERAAAPTFRRTGKMDMTRSVLHNKKPVKETVSQAKAKAADSELDKYIAQEFP